MSELQIAWLELLLVGGIGLILTLSGIIIDIVAKKHNKLCTKQIEGRVIRHRYLGGEHFYPIVEYYVDGIRYETRKKFRGIKTMKISGILAIRTPAEAYEDEKGWLHIKRGSIVNVRQLAEQLWPVDSKMTVYYNPNNPKTCYVDRPISGSLTTIMFIIMGIVTIAIGILVFFLVQL